MKMLLLCFGQYKATLAFPFSENVVRVFFAQDAFRLVSLVGFLSFSILQVREGEVLFLCLLDSRLLKSRLGICPIFSGFPNTCHWFSVQRKGKSF